MKKQTFLIPLGLLTAFGLWTAAVMHLDVQPIGPGGSAVGLAALNGTVHRLIGVNLRLYTLTDWLGLVPILFALGFALLGLTQWIRRRDLRKVDRDLLLLGGFYIVTMGAYLFFEICVINFRPVLIDGILEASYPSSTTLLTLCVMPTAMEQLRRRIRHPGIRNGVLLTLALFTGFMVVGRLLSGVHWVSDIIGGTLLSAGLVTLYHTALHSIGGNRDA